MRRPVSHKVSRLAYTALTGVLAYSFVPSVTATAQDVQDETTTEEIVITGSRIVRPEIDSPNPVNVVGASDIVSSGEVDIGALLREVPALNGSLTATGSVNTGQEGDLTDDTGVARLDLRNLGPNRTLVLVNGRRHVGSIQGDAAVDVSTIPLSLIERVETLTGGASAIYGADAVSGVVNFVLKEDFEGLEYRGQIGISDEGDAENYYASVTGGFNFDNDRGNAVLSVEYTKQEPLLTRDRDSIAGTGLFSLFENSPELVAAFGRDPDAINVFAPDFRFNFSSADGIIRLFDPATAIDFGSTAFDGVLENIFGADQGSIAGVPGAQVFNNGALRAFDPGILSGRASRASGGDGITVSNPNALIVADFERINVNANLNYKLHDYVTFFVESKFVLTEAVNSGGVPFNDDIPIALDNAFIPDALRTQIDDAIAAGISPQISFSRDFLDVATIANDKSDRYTFRIVGGVRGEFDNGWRYEASYNFGRTEINTTSENSRLEDRFFAGVDAVVDPNTGEIVCRSDLDPTALPGASPFPDSRRGFLTFDPGPDSGCIPINLFGQDSITEESSTFAFVDVLSNTELEQQQILLTLSGDSSEYFELPAGPIAFALGYEYRKEESEFVPSEFEQAGLLYNTLNERASPVFGRFDLNEVFIETEIPILADLPFAETLNLSGSYRYSDHSTAGSIDTYGAGLVWQPISDIRFRGSYNRAVRAPNIFELFSPPQVAFLNIADDPCNVSNITGGTSFRAQNCQTLVGAGFDANNFLTARTAGTTGGNPDLQPEVADTYTIGAVITPRWVPGLTITVDYYNIEIEGAIDSLSGEAIAEFCVDLPTLENDFCNLITRDPNRGNAIVDFRSGNVNLGAFSTEGVDFSVNYTFDLEDLVGSDFGTISQTVTGTHLLNNIEFPDQNDLSQEFPREGELNFPDWIVNYNANWKYEDFGLTYQMRYQSSQLLAGIENENIAGNANFVDPFRTGNAFIHDISFNYNLNQYVNITAGVNNLADRKPFAASLVRPVDPIGRTFFLGVQGSF